ncbi:proton-coupled amino acid transporter 1-like [Onthophagus taurus]|uniref:proton-coupled amino acid transporter 1-like n=1 Tax=Onthophagus taurus TaxID=166361 RepID=UPI0039BEAEE4
MINYLQTLMHMIKGIIGSGIFSMGVAFKEAGMIIALILTPIIGLVICHCATLLVRIAEYIEILDQEELNEETKTDSSNLRQYSYAELTETVFQRSSILKSTEANNKLAKFMKRFTVIGLCTMNLGFCCCYVVFLGANMSKVLGHFNIYIEIHILMVIAIIPMWLLSLITKLAILAPFSMIANAILFCTTITTLWYICHDLPHVTTTKYVGDADSFPVFVGIVLCTYECIPLIVPLRNDMKEPQKMVGTFGVLNMAFLLITPFVIIMGCLSYMQYGEDIHGTVFINLPETTGVEILITSVCILVILTYPLQMYIPVNIMWPLVTNRFGPFKRPLFSELCFRSLLVAFTLVIGQIIPFIHLIMSLIGAVCSTSLTLFLPPFMDLILFYPQEKVWFKKAIKVTKNGMLFLSAVGTFIFGIYATILSIIEEFAKK